MFLNITRPCPIHPNERDENGNILPEFAYKANRTCWEEHHGGEKFLGKETAAFGQLVWYREKGTHSMLPNCVPGIFLCWHLETGLRYRDTMYVASFADYAKGNYGSRPRLVPEAEIFFPQDLGVFPNSSSSPRC